MVSKGVAASCEEGTQGGRACAGEEYLDNVAAKRRRRLLPMANFAYVPHQAKAESSVSCLLACFRNDNASQRAPKASSTNNVKPSVPAIAVFTTTLRLLACALATSWPNSASKSADAEAYRRYAVALPHEICTSNRVLVEGTDGCTSAAV
eukprot:scaffold58147_cov31-Tisochrysis_lutea.AAC.3